MLATLGTDVKDAALEAIAAALLDRTPEILEANARDLEAGQGTASRGAVGPSALDAGGVAEMAAGVRKIVALPDPVGEVIDGRGCPTG